MEREARLYVFDASLLADEYLRQPADRRSVPPLEFFRKLLCLY